MTNGLFLSGKDPLIGVEARAVRICSWRCLLLTDNHWYGLCRSDSASRLALDHDLFIAHHDQAALVHRSLSRVDRLLKLSYLGYFCRDLIVYFCRGSVLFSILSILESWIVHHVQFFGLNIDQCLKLIFTADFVSQVQIVARVWGMNLVSWRRIRDWSCWIKCNAASYLWIRKLGSWDLTGPVRCLASLSVISFCRIDRLLFIDKWFLHFKI